MCSDEEYNAWKAQYSATIHGNLMYVNTHIMNGPTCLMTQNQSIDINQYIGSNGIATFNNFQDEMCFSSAASLKPVLLLLLAVVAAGALLF